MTKQQKPIEVVRLTTGEPIGGVYCRCGHHDIDHINATGVAGVACRKCDCDMFRHRANDQESETG